MNEITPEMVRQFLRNRYAEHIRGMGLDPVTVPDTFDLFLEGVVDSLGILELVGAIEKEFNIELDMASLEPERMTIMGPLATYVAEYVNSRSDAQKAPAKNG